MKAKVNFENIVAYLQGWLRYKLYYSKFKFLIRKHILEQIDFRIKYMDKECYENGSCKLCGCATTALQMADKQCDKPCYPPILNKIQWRSFQVGNRIFTPLYIWQLDNYYFNNHPDQFKVVLRMNIHTPFIEKILPNDRENYKTPQKLEVNWKEYSSQEEFDNDKTNNNGQESPLVSIFLKEKDINNESAI